MKFAPKWADLPSPVDFIRTVVRDLQDGNSVILGFPNHFSEGLSVIIKDACEIKQLGKWYTVDSNEVQKMAPKAFVDVLNERDLSSKIIWVEAIDYQSAKSWADYVSRYAGIDTVSCVCIATVSASARKIDLEKRLKRRLWCSFVSSTDSQVVSERYCRESNCKDPHTEMKSALIAKLAGADLARADMMSRAKLSDLFDTNEYNHNLIWAAQVSVLYPLINNYRQRLLKEYDTNWEVLHHRNEIKIIKEVNKLEIGDMYSQAKMRRMPKLVVKQLFLLRNIRNMLAHHEVIPWDLLNTLSQLNIADFRK